MRIGARFASRVLVLLLLAVATGCSSPEAAPPGKTAQQVLAEAKTVVDQSPSVHLAVSSRDLPDSASGVVSGEGVGTHPPAFKGTFQAKVSGTQASVEIVAVDGKVWTKLPFTSVFVQVDPARFGILDPATLLSPDAGLTSLLTKTQNPAIGTQVRRGSEVLATVTGSLPGSAIADLLGVGQRDGTFAVTYGVVDANRQLRTVEMTGPFFPGATSTYAVTLDKYGEPVEIRAP